MKNYTGQDARSCSEKYDGLQGQWDGETLTTRTGNVINAPEWWLESLPNEPLTGELWTARNDFSGVQSIVSRKVPGPEWNRITFLTFDGETSGRFHRPVERHPVKNAEKFYRQVLRKGGEGIVYHGAMDYKRKPTEDDDGVLTGFKPGKNGPVGSYLLRLRDGRTLAVGGLTEDLKAFPPTIGCVIKFQFQGRTSKGLPRFAKYDGIRAEKTLNF